MAVVTKAVLKTYFETGDKPTEAQFVDLIDSLFGLLDAPVAGFRAFGEYANQATTGLVSEQLSGTYTLPANTLDTDGKAVRITAFGVCVPNVNGKSAGIRFGGFLFIIGATPGTVNLTNWKMVVEIVRSAVDQQEVNIHLDFGTSPSTESQSVANIQETQFALDDASNQDIEIWGQTPGAIGDLTLNSWYVELLQ